MSLTDTKNIMVYVETANGAAQNVSLEALAGAAALAKEKNEKVTAVLIGKDLDEAAKKAIEAGADTAVVVEKDGYQLEVYAAVLTALVKKYSPSLLLAGATQYGKDLMPEVASALETGCATDVTDIRFEDGGYVFTCPVYGGSVLNDVKLSGVPAVATVRSGAFSKNLSAGKTGEIVKEEVEVPAESVLTKIVDVVREITESENLEEADVVVTGGRGMGSLENFQLIHELAKVCGGMVGGTRPVIEEEWISRSRQVGQSGKIVAPKLYFACGVSGATQHVSGMIGSGYIVAINKDEDAPIFDVADVGIVGDAVKILPLLIEAIKKAKAE